MEKSSQKLDEGRNPSTVSPQHNMQSDPTRSSQVTPPPSLPASSVKLITLPDLCKTSTAVVTDYYKLSSMKQHNLLPCTLQVRSPKWVSAS